MKGNTLGDFSRSNQQMGNVLIDQGLALIGNALATDQATKDAAIAQVSSVVSGGIMDNKEKIIFGLVVLGASMALVNGLITYTLIDSKGR